MGSDVAKPKEMRKPEPRSEGYQVTQFGAFGVCAATFGAGAADESA